MATLAVTGRSDLTDGQWAVLAPLLPVGRRPGRPPKWSKRQLIDGIRWRIRAGTPWRDVPPVYGPWQTVYGLFRRWQRAHSPAHTTKTRGTATTVSCRTNRAPAPQRDASRAASTPTAS